MAGTAMVKVHAYIAPVATKSTGEEYIQKAAGKMTPFGVYGEEGLLT